ncbi:methyltransferase [Sphingobacterium sp. SRCM116780]|uniref:tRNA1(Val) (adenine(37)-N6)-methyltransferase n=1 Tax=Sphingobacterium sp. SRCM116780 TaxID=2907623 RepID=UPI001F3604D4|nr:methyltransferase [Sphingobacterium sp. SRCM116780]UIR55234.1 methyltransferase [Sphingobacterium sp. SRCM116780]
MASIFQFKEFAVDQTDCAMKINTDAVLLASLVDVGESKRILDIGTGTGVIALMLAQRCTESQVVAVEIDSAAAQRAQENFRNSRFHDRMKLHACAFQELADEDTFDFIISNPPFYTDSLHNPDARKKLARHTNLEFFDELFQFCSQYLSTKGKLALILPTLLADELTEMAKSIDLNLQQEILIRSFDGGEVIRKIILFEMGYTGAIASTEFIIYQEKGMHSEGYKAALKPYFLAF